jgi:hypothetical protein
MMGKMAMMSILLALGAAFVTGVYHAGKQNGRIACERTYQQAADKQRKEDDDAVKRVEDAEKGRREIVLVDREVVKNVVDPAGCLDVRPPAALSERVRDARARAAPD